MKRQTMYSNVNQKLAESFANKQIKSKSSNEEFLQMITRVRSLEDQLLAEQYRHQLLKQQNQTYKEAFHSLQTNSELQSMRLAKLDEEMELHNIKNKELHICQESLKSLEKHIKDLTKEAQKKSEECESFQIQARNISQQCQNLKRQHKQLYQKHTFLNSLIMNYITESYMEQDIDDHPIDYLRLRIQTLRQLQAEKESQESNLSLQQSEALHKERQKTIRLQYEQKLLSQRERDDQKISQISRVCESHQNLEHVVEEMLKKQDQLLEELNNQKYMQRQIDEQIRRDIQHVQQNWDQERQRYQKELRELKKNKQMICFERELLQEKLKQKKNIMIRQNQDEDLFFKINSELSALKRLRTAQQRNNHLKIKIKQFSQIKNMLLREKEIIKSLNIY